MEQPISTHSQKSADQQRSLVSIADRLPCVGTTRPPSHTHQQTKPRHVIVPRRREHYEGDMSRHMRREIEEWEQAEEGFYDNQLSFHEEYEDRELQYLTGDDAEQWEQREPIELEENWQQQQQRDFALVEQFEQSERLERQELVQQLEFHDPLKHSQQQQPSNQ